MEVGEMGVLDFPRSLTVVVAGIGLSVPDGGVRQETAAAESLAIFSELAIGPAGDLYGRFHGRQPVDQSLEGLDEGRVNLFRLDLLLVIPVDHQALDGCSLQVRPDYGQEVHVDHDLDDVGSPGPARLRVGDPDQVALAGNEVRLAGDGGQPSLDGEVVLGLVVDLVTLLPELSGLGVFQVRMAYLPAGQVGHSFGPGPAVAVELGLEPGGVFTAVVAGEELCEPGDPDVGTFLVEHGHDCHLHEVRS